MKKLINVKRLLRSACVLAAAVLTFGVSHASTNFIDFNSDPTGGADLTVLHRPGAGGGGLWYPTDGAPSDPFGTNGYFSITDGTSAQRCTVIFNDFDAGLVVKGFTMAMDIRVGLGSASPADGFSINYARANDPVIVNNDGTGFAASPTGEADLEEEGTTTGLAVTFDSWFSGGSDVVGITIRVDNNIVTNVPMGVAHGGCTNLQSIQTDDLTASSLADVCWTKLVVQLTTNGLLNLSYKGATFLTNFPTTFNPGAGRLILAGRTGDSSQNAHVDNISIVTIPATGPAVGSVFPTYYGFTTEIDDSGAATPNTNTLTVQLDGVTIISHGTNVSSGVTSVTKSGVATTITYSQAALFASGSSHSVHVTFSGTGFSGTVDETRNFTALTYPTLPVGLRTALGTGDAARRGFRISIWQADNTLNIFDGWQNQIIFDEEQLAGLINTNPAAGTTATNVADLSAFTNNGDYLEPSVINYSISFASGSIQPDTALPGLPGTLGIYDNVVYGIRTFVEFPTNGLYTMGVASDDGFRVTVGDRTGPGVGLQVTAPSAVAGRYFAVPTATDYGQGFGRALPAPPLLSRAVVADPILAGGPLNNAAAIAGKVAIVQRGTFGFAVKARNCQDAGALAIIIADSDIHTDELPGIMGGADGTVTIPCLMISYADGTNLIAHADTTSSSPMTVQIGDDSSLKLAEFNGGRGGGTPTVFSFYVAQPGVYPLRLLYENGGGDANVEWWTVSGGTTNLINDPASELKAYQSRVVSGGSAHLNQPTVSGNNVIISWTGEGELEQAFSITGPWFKSPYQTNPAAVPINSSVTGTSFFRIRQY